jgi:glycosyltransferase involved in cell wall biosynthesis
VSGRAGSLSVLAVRAVRAARTQKLRVLLLVSQALPTRVRRAIYRPAGRAADVFLRRRGDHGIAAPIRVIATEAIEGQRAAALQAEGLSATASRRTGYRLARVMLAVGDPATAGRILAGHPASPDVASVKLRGEVALRLGNYTGALEAVGPIAERRRDEGVRRIVNRAQSELAVLDPAWRPDLGGVAAGARPLDDPVRGRILHILTNSLPQRQAGYTVRAQSVALAQRAIGLDPQMVTRAGFPRNEGVSMAARRDVVDGITYHRIRPDLEPEFGAAWVATETARGLVPLIGSLRPALLQPTTNYVNAQVALALGERFDLPVVYEVRGFLEETWLSRIGAVAGEGDRYHAARAVETACMRRAAGIVTLSETMRADIIGRGGIEPDVVTVIPNAVDIERFRPGPRDPALAAKLGIEDDEVVVGYISTFTAYEGIRYLIEAVGLLRGRGRRLRLLLVGDGEQRADLEIAAAEAGLTDGTVIFTGRVPHGEIERYYRTIDVFVVPRTNDRVSQLVTPLKPYEAMAMEKAIVVSGVGALLEIVVDGETGRSFVPEDAVSLADLIEPLLDDPAERARLGTAARAWVAANRTWERNGRRYRELYERLGVA